jgi:hypothetical protein
MFPSQSSPYSACAYSLCVSHCIALAIPNALENLFSQIFAPAIGALCSFPASTSGSGSGSAFQLDAFTLPPLIMTVLFGLFFLFQLAHFVLTRNDAANSDRSDGFDHDGLNGGAALCVFRRMFRLSNCRPLCWVFSYLSLSFWQSLPLCLSSSLSFSS